MEKGKGQRSLFLVDECRSFPEGKRNCKGVVWSVDVLGAGVSDNEVLKYAKKKNLPIFTSDKKFSIRIAIQGHPVIFHDSATSNYIIKAIPSEGFTKYSDAVTFHLIENEKIICP